MPWQAGLVNGVEVSLCKSALATNIGRCVCPVEKHVYMGIVVTASSAELLDIIANLLIFYLAEQSDGTLSWVLSGRMVLSHGCKVGEASQSYNPCNQESSGLLASGAARHARPVLSGDGKTLQAG